jgi:hypothetical protein
MLAFLVDQIQQLGDALFQAVLKKKKRLIRVWEQMRALFNTLEFKSMQELYHGNSAKVTLSERASKRVLSLPWGDLASLPF